MNADRFHAITSRYPKLRIAVVGDFCLDRYLEIDPARGEISIETGLAVYNVVRVRAQPGGAGTILNNLVALGVGEIVAVGFCGDDGEGYELRRELAKLPGVRLDHFLMTPDRLTFTYAKPLILATNGIPVEQNRLDTKNWSPTPLGIQEKLAQSLRDLIPIVDAVVVLDQVDEPETGVVTRGLLKVIGELAASHPEVIMIADSRQGLRDWPRVIYKMNAAELGSLVPDSKISTIDEVSAAATELSSQNRQPVFVTLAERGIVIASSDGQVQHVHALPVRGPIDIVGAGDAVTANLTCALAANASPREAAELASVAASLVIHQVGTTGSARVVELLDLLDPARS